MTILTQSAYLLSAILFMVSLKWLGSPKTARRAMAVSMLGMFLAVAPTLVPAVNAAHESGMLGAYLGVVFGAIALGTVIGLVAATKVKMTAMPQMVGLFNGFGGGASLLVAMVEYLSKAPPTRVGLGDVTLTFGSTLDVGSSIPIHVVVIVGGITLTGSLVAFGKLQGLISGKPVLFPGQHLLNLLLLLGAVVIAVVLVVDPGNVPLFIVMAALSLVLGFLVVIPIGGADMPVIISLLNSYSGLAVATTGFVLRNNVLIIVGSLVGASGLILTRIMCKAMNRSLANVMFGGFGAAPSGAGAASGTGDRGAVREASAEEAASIMANAQSMIVVPGYGMAVAQAQHAVRELAGLLEEKGVKVKYAIHPVAGRMPGHMNVLLAEANVPYDQLFELEAINDEFQNTDVSLVVGANDVVNPAAKEDSSSPIYGMPVLNVEHSKAVFVLKRSMNPGFAGIENELFVRDNTMMVFGDAKKTLTEMSGAVKEGA